MLKIKNNIDLTELEKFGFEKIEHYGTVDYFCDLGDNRSHIFVYAQNENCNDVEKIVRGQIALTTGYFGDYAETWFGDKQLDVLYDLIKADMVEKVEK